MLAALADPILPVFAVLVAGYLLRKTGKFDDGHATAINRYVFFLGAPALVFLIIMTAPLDGLYWPALGIYLAAEISTYTVVALIALRVFQRDLGEALLLGMAASFANHVFFVRPIAIFMYGADAVFPIAGIVVFEVLVFCTTVFLMDLLVAQRGDPKRAALALVQNPFVYAPLLAGLAWWLGDATPKGVMTFARFAAESAAPVSLFALGIVLAGTSLIRFGALLWIVVAAKLVVHPALVYGGLQLTGATGSWSAIPLLVAAGPCGAMPFVIATQYGVRTDVIAKAILISTTLSLVSISVLI